MPHQERIMQEDFRAGIVRHVAPNLIPPHGAYDIDNALVGEDGSAHRRGGSSWHSGAAFGTRLTGIWDGHLNPGRRTLVANPTDFGVLDANDSTVVNLGSDGLADPVAMALIEDMLFIGGGYIYGGSRKALSYSAGTVSVTNASKVVTGTTTAFLANVDPGMLFQRGSERVYVIASVDSDTQLTLRDAYEGTTAAGQAYTAHNIYKMTAADPYKETLSILAVVANRLIGLKGTTVFVSDIGKPHKWTHTIGGTEVAAEVEIAEGIRITGLGVIGQLLLVFTTGGVWVIDGLAFDITDDLGNANYREQVLSRDLVLFGQAGIAEWEQALVVPCINGVYLLDGVSRPVRLSRSIDPLYRGYTEGSYLPGGAATFQNHYLLPILRGDGTVADCLVCRLNALTDDGQGNTIFPWVRLTNHGAQMTAFAVRAED